MRACATRMSLPVFVAVFIGVWQCVLKK
jgi:hypothetical protein